MKPFAQMSLEEYARWRATHAPPGQILPGAAAPAGDISEAIRLEHLELIALAIAAGVPVLGDNVLEYQGDLYLEGPRYPARRGGILLGTVAPDWRWGPFERRMSDRDKEGKQTETSIPSEGYIRFPIAIYEFAKNKFNLTHMPSGLSFGLVLPSVKEAARVADYLLAQHGKLLEFRDAKVFAKKHPKNFEALKSFLHQYRLLPDIKKMTPGTSSYEEAVRIRAMVPASKVKIHRNPDRPPAPLTAEQEAQERMFVALQKGLAAAPWRTGPCWFQPYKPGYRCRPWSFCKYPDQRFWYGHHQERIRKATHLGGIAFFEYTQNVAQARHEAFQSGDYRRVLEEATCGGWQVVHAASGTPLIDTCKYTPVRPDPDHYKIDPKIFPADGPTWARTVAFRLWRVDPTFWEHSWVWIAQRLESSAWKTSPEGAEIERVRREIRLSRNHNAFAGMSSDAFVLASHPWNRPG